MARILNDTIKIRWPARNPRTGRPVGEAQSDAISRFHNRRYPIFFVRQSTLVRLKRELRLNMHAMKAIAIIALLLLVVVNALELLPAASAFQMYLSGGAVALSFVCELQSALG